MKSFYLLMYSHLLMYSLFTCMFAFSGIASAESISSSKNIGVIIIGDNEFKTEKYFQRSAAVFDAKKISNVSVEVGEDIQKRYLNYCKDKSIDSNDMPKLENLLEFATQNNFDNILCLTVQYPKIINEYSKLERGVFDLLEYNRYITVSLTVNAYFCDKTKLLKACSVTNKKEKKGKDHEREKILTKVKRSTFTLCVDDIRKTLKDLW